jgi:GTPase SAR1 family protein
VPHNIKFIVIGNKIDLANERVVPTGAGDDTAMTFQALFYAEASAETSAEIGEGINEIFTQIAELDPT